MIFIIMILLVTTAVILYHTTNKTSKEGNIKTSKESSNKTKKDHTTFNTISEEARRKQEWAQRMAEIRKQKKIEHEQEEAKRLEKEKREKNAHIESFAKIGSTIIFYDYGVGIEANETIMISDLFSSINKLKYPWQCSIIGLDGEQLLTFRKGSIYLCIEDINKGFDNEKDLEKFLYCYLENRKIQRCSRLIDNILKDGIAKVETLSSDIDETLDRIKHILIHSDYGGLFEKSIECLAENDMIVINYNLPCTTDIPTEKEYKFIASKREISIKKHPDAYLSKLYEHILYSITLRSIFETFYADDTKRYNGITFNGYISSINPSTGILEHKCILSIQTNRDRFNSINLEHVEPKACFKNLKGVSAAKLIDESPIVPILSYNKHDKRFIAGRNVDIDRGTNLAAMHWEDFEQLVRELFELEFANNGSEVHVTQASRDGGVDAVIFDPDPLRGGKIVIQAKRYTNTVGVSAVRDLYGTVINEGANTGILITTSDYGHDSYEFAKDKPLKLLNGGHLLSLLHKNGRNAHINIEEAREQLKSEKN